MNKKNLKKALAAMAVVGLVSQETSASNLPILHSDLNPAGTSIMNKLVFSQESVIAEYSRMSQLPVAERQTIASRIRANFAVFMNDKFYLTNNQISCLTNYWTTTEDAAFINFLATRIEAGDVVAWDIDFTHYDDPPVLMGKPKKRKIEAGWSEGKGWSIGFGIEF